ncbi:MAG: hypothetical protein ACYTEK_00185 [Planctomycetota bacterium]|jgi:hypothetical protein
MNLMTAVGFILLAVLRIYGVLAHSVVLRAMEIGILLALGTWDPPTSSAIPYGKALALLRWAPEAKINRSDN